MSDILKKYGVIPSGDNRAPQKSGSVLDKYGVNQAVDAAVQASEGGRDKKIKEVTEAPSNLEIAARGAAQGVTFDHADELEAGLREMVRLADRPYAKGYPPGLHEAEPDVYRANLGKVRERYKRAQEANPGLYTGTQLAGAVGSSFIPGLGTLRATRAGRAGQSLLEGMLAAEGRSESSLTDPALAKEVLVGGGVNAALPLLSAPTRKFAEFSARTHLSPVANLVETIGEEGADKAARAALDSGAIRFGATAKGTFKRLRPIVKAEGKALEGLRNQQAGTPIDPRYTVQQIEDQVLSPLMKAESANADRIAAIRRYIDNFTDEYGQKSNKAFDFDALVAQRSGLDKKVYQNQGAIVPTLIKEDRKKIAGVLRSIEDAVATPEYVAQKGVYNPIANAMKMARRTAAKKGLMQHIADVGVGTTVINQLYNNPENPTGPLGLAAARALSRGRMASSFATGANQLSRLMNTRATSRAVPVFWDYLGSRKEE